MKPADRTLLVFAAMLAIAVPTDAQVDPAAHLAGQIAGRAGDIRSLQLRVRLKEALKPDETPRQNIDLQVDFEPIYLSLMVQISKRAQLAIEERRADKQVGDAGGSTAGSTSLVSKGGTPAVLAFAVENGALTQDVSGTTVTFRGTPAGIVKALQKGYFDTLKTDDAAVAVLQRFSFSASFDTSRGLAEEAQPTFTADRGQFAGATLRIVAVDNKDPRVAANDRRWDALVPETLRLNEKSLAVFGALGADPAISGWVAVARKAVEAAPPDKIEMVVADQFAALASVDIAPTTRAAVEAAAQQFDTFLKQRADILRVIEGGGQLVFDLAYQKPETGQEFSNLKVVGSVGRSILLTGNAAVTVYHGQLPSGADRLRDVQGAVQLDIPFGNPDGIGRYVFSLSAKVQHMPKDVVADKNALFPGTKGTIGLGQAKLTIPVRGSAAKIPLSITLANRTELIDEDKVFVRANVGFSYDLDAVLARFKP